MGGAQTNATNAKLGQATDAQLTLSISQDATQESRRERGINGGDQQMAPRAIYKPPFT